MLTLALCGLTTKTEGKGLGQKCKPKKLSRKHLSLTAQALEQSYKNCLSTFVNNIIKKTAEPWALSRGIVTSKQELPKEAF